MIYGLQRSLTFRQTLKERGREQWLCFKSCTMLVGAVGKTMGNEQWAMSNEQ